MTLYNPIMNMLGAGIHDRDNAIYKKEKYSIGSKFCHTTFKLI